MEVHRDTKSPRFSNLDRVDHMFISAFAVWRDEGSLFHQCHICSCGQIIFWCPSYYFGDSIYYLAQFNDIYAPGQCPKVTFSWPMLLDNEALKISKPLTRYPLSACEHTLLLA